MAVKASDTGVVIFGVTVWVGLVVASAWVFFGPEAAKWAGKIILAALTLFWTVITAGAIWDYVK